MSQIILKTCIIANVRIEMSCHYLISATPIRRKEYHLYVLIFLTHSFHCLKKAKELPGSQIHPIDSRRFPVSRRLTARQLGSCLPQACSTLPAPLPRQVFSRPSTEYRTSSDHVGVPIWRIQIQFNFTLRVVQQQATAQPDRGQH